MKKIILASSSPRRKQLLQLLIGDNFEIQTSDYKEDNTLKMSPKDLASSHALKKGRDVAKKFNDAIIISADTIVVLNNKILGKPNDAQDAKQMLQNLSGNIVEVISGIAVIDSANKKELQDYAITEVKMKKMSEKEINDYVKSGEPLDKAGAFGIQGKAAIFIEKINGCYFNIVGLPLFKLNKMLEKLEISIFDY